MKGFVTDTVVFNLRGYKYAISEENIHRYGFEGESVSKGLLVKDHFTEVYRAIAVIEILRKGKCKDAMAQYMIEDQKVYDEAPDLIRCIDALEKQLTIIVGEGAQESTTYYHKRYNNETAQIASWLIDLREGRWYGASPAWHRPGVPRIETTGKKLYGAVLDLFWKMDDDAPSQLERMREKLERADDEKPKWSEEDLAVLNWNKDS